MSAPLLTFEDDGSLRHYAELRAEIQAQRAEVSRLTAERDAKLEPDMARVLETLRTECTMWRARAERAEGDLVPLRDAARRAAVSHATAEREMARVVETLKAECAAWRARAERAEEHVAPLREVLVHVVRAAPPPEPNSPFAKALDYAKRALDETETA